MCIKKIEHLPSSNSFLPKVPRRLLSIPTDHFFFRIEKWSVNLHVNFFQIKKFSQTSNFFYVHLFQLCKFFQIEYFFLLFIFSLTKSLSTFTSRSQSLIFWFFDILSILTDKQREIIPKSEKKFLRFSEEVIEQTVSFRMKKKFSP